MKLESLEAPLLGVRKWLVGSEGWLNSTVHRGMWEPGEDMVARGCESRMHHVITKVKAVNPREELVSLAQVRLASGFPWSMERLGRRLARLDAASAWPLRYQTLATEERVDPGHDAPGEGCTCGLYAFYSLGEAVKYSTLLGDALGLVCAWGDIAMHDWGYRASHMRICALIEGFGSGPVVHKLYGVPLIKAEDIALFALAEGLHMHTPGNRVEPNQKEEDV